tara:strand:- start:1072 stop:1497 length:426 start_codon:yes stop_codon:yes gene_type:complete
MARPLYETSEDLSREANVMQTAASKWKCDYLKLPLSYRLDFALVRSNKVAALAEIRVRNVAVSTYPTIIFSVLKRATANMLSAQIAVPSFFIVKYDDEIRYIDFAETPDEFQVGGRTGANRRDHADVELVGHYDVMRMKVL